MANNKKENPPSIEIKTNYVHKTVVENMLKKRMKAGVDPIGLITTDRISDPAKKLLDEKGISYAEIPESEIREQETKEKERGE